PPSLDGRGIVARARPAAMRGELDGFFARGVYERSMARLLARDLIRQGVSTSRALMSHQDKIWSRYSRDKVDIGETLARVLRTLAKALPLDLPLRALSVGSSTEPQFRILEASFRGGLYLLDIERAALAVINERMRRQ